MDIKNLTHASWIIGAVFVVVFAGHHDTMDANEEKIVKVRDVDVEIDYEPVGCFKDNHKPRTLRVKVKNFRKFLGKKLWSNWPNMSLVIQLCAEEAFQKGYTAMFGVQFYGECFSDNNAEQRYFIQGGSTACINGVGKHWANFIYRTKVKPIPPKAPSSVCNVNGQTFKTGDSLEVLKNNADTRSAQCHQCTCLEGKLVDCHHIFHCTVNDTDCKGYAKISGQCCPACKRDVPIDGPVCNVDDWVYKHGDSMEVLKDFDGKQTAECHQCTCKSGKLEDCHRIFYCKPSCKNSIRIPGQCCPTCVSSVIPKPSPPFCEVSGRKYKDGESMEVLKNNTDCYQCECIGGKVDDCHHIFHCSLNGSDCDRFEQIPGQCCPQCIAPKSNVYGKTCKINGLLYKDGESAEVLHESEDKTNIFCQQCRCTAGQYSCHKIYDCHVQEMACERTVMIPGLCCPKCGCYNEGQKMSSGDKWEKLIGDTCVKCTCHKDGSATCTRSLAGEICPPCDNPIPVKGRCCPSCG